MNMSQPKVATLRWENGSLRLIDQRKLPAAFEIVTCRTAEEVADAIRHMVVRGAPAIGATAGYGIAIGVIALSIHLVNLQSFGVSYLSPVAPIAHGDSTDIILRAPRRLLNRRNS